MGWAKCSPRGSADMAAAVGPGWRYSCATKGSERGGRSGYPVLEDGFIARPGMESRSRIGGRIGLGPRDAFSGRCMWWPGSGMRGW